MRRRLLLVAASLALAWAGSAGAQAPAQGRSPAERQSLIDLAYVLGQSHALRQACEGPTDQFWRARMSALVATERPDPAFDRQLRDAFNTGFSSTEASFPRCTPAARREAEVAAARGGALAASLTGPVADDDPSR